MKCVKKADRMIGKEASAGEEQRMKGKWIIQDTENMVDLSFTPISDHSRIVSIMVLRAQKHIMYGTFEGMLKTKDGREIPLKDFSGMVRKQLMRL